MTHPLSASPGATDNIRGPRRTWLAGITAFSIMAVDGFDTAAISYVAPTVAARWSLPPAALTPAFMMTSLGAVIGYLLSGRAVTRFGRHRLVTASMIGFALLSLASAAAGSIVEMSVLRLLTALFLGLAVPATIAGATGHASAGRRSAVAAAVATGISAGGAIGGGMAALLIAHFGWQAIFIVGGILPLLLLRAAHVLLRDPPNAMPATRAATVVCNGRADGQPFLRAMVRAPYTLSSYLLFALACLGFLLAYALLFWIPTFLVSFGFAPATAALGAMAASAGGMVGSVALVASAGRIAEETVLMSLTALGIACVAGLTLGGLHGEVAALLFVAGIGAATGAICVGQAALAVRIYPTELRTAGIGYAAACGRVGSVIGPAVVGALLARGCNALTILGWATMPMIALFVLLAMLKRRGAPFPR